MLDGLGEVGEDELITAFDAGVDDLLEHLNDAIVDRLASFSLLFDHAANLGVSLSFFLNKGEDAELLEALGARKLCNDGLLGALGVIGTAGSDEQDGGLDVAAQLLERLVKVLLGVDASEVSVFLEEGQKLLDVLVVLADALGEDGGGLVAGITRVKADHALLAKVHGALKYEDSGRSDAVLHEELGLELGLGEVLKENARANLLRHLLDESTSLGGAIGLAEVLGGKEVVEVDDLHVGALTESFTEGRLARGLRSADPGDLREHSTSGVSVDVLDVTVGVDATNLAELLIVVDDGQVLLLVGSETLLDGFSVIVRATLTAAVKTLNASLLGAVEEQDVLGLADVSLEVGALLNFPGETVNKVVLYIKANN